MPEEIDPAIWARPELRLVLINHDFATLFRALGDMGISQRQIATLTGRSQSNISEIIHGRRVTSYPVLVELTEGLGVPRERMGLGWWGPNGSYYGPAQTYGGGVTATEGDEEMLRRHFERLLGLGAAAVFGAPVTGVGAIGEIVDLAPPPLSAEVPDRIGMTDVTILRSYREHLANLARALGGQAGPAMRLADWAEKFLGADCSEAVRAALLSELAHLHTITAWCCHDSGATTRSPYHFGRAIELATQAGDAYQAAYAMHYAGPMLAVRGRPNDALKVLQLGEVRLLDASPDDPRVPALASGFHAESALALSQLDEPRPVQTRAQLAQARDGWEPPDAHAQARMDMVTARTLLHLKQFDATEAAAALAVRTYSKIGYRRGGVIAELTLAQAYVQAGEPRGLTLAKTAIDSVSATRSAVARQIWLPPLAEALEARPNSDAKQLARMARQIAT